jgi:hypothetical protein
VRRCASILARPLAFVALAFVACGEALFPCSVDGDCQDGGQGGMCQPEGVCSFPDDDCPSGQRFGAHAGALAGECVSPSVADTSGPPTTAPADDDDDGDPTLDVTGVDTGPSTSSGIGPLDDTATTNDDATSGTTGVELDPTLLLWFPFEDDGVGELTNHGSLGGTAPCHLGQCPTSLPAGPVGAAATFDGVDDCGIFPFVDELAATEFTLALWVRRDVHVQGYDGAFTKPVGASAYNTWRVSLQGSMPSLDIVSIHVGLQDDTGVELVSTLVLGTWTHMATTWTGSELELFIDGASVGAMPSDLFEVDDHDVYVGCDDDVPVGITHFVNGSLDDVRMYARVLDPMEIAALAAM